MTDLRDEAERIARALLGEVSFASVADDVEHALSSLDLDDLGSRAGRHHGGYTSPTEAAWELLQEAVDPFLEDMERQMQLGLEVEALEICKGILVGLSALASSTTGTTRSSGTPSCGFSDERWKRWSRRSTGTTT